MKNLITILCLCLFWFSCEEDNNDNSLEYTYPISLGNTWIYEGSIIHEPLDSTFCFENVSILDTIIIDSLYNDIDNIYRFKTSTTEMSLNDSIFSSSSGYQYFSNSNNGLYYHGSEGGGGLVNPWSESSQISYKINDHSFTRKQLIDFFINRNECWEDPPLLSIKYPIIENEQWTWREFSNSCDTDSEPIPFKMDKLVTDINSNTFTIQVLYDLNEDSEWDESITVYKTFSSNGMTEYRVELDSLQCTSQDGTSFFNNVIFNHTLINYQID